MIKSIKKLVIILIIVTIAIPNTYVEAQSQVSIGDYIEFGSYNNEKLLWQVIGFDENGKGILWSSSVVELLAFDAAESGVSGVGTTASDKYGSNQFFNSNIKEWLNSSSQVVNFTTTKPTASAVVEVESFDGIMSAGAYDKANGFLFQFSRLEQDALVNRNLYTKEVSNVLENNYTYSITSIEDAYKGFNYGDYREEEAKVFLLSLAELKNLVEYNNLSLSKTIRDSLDSQYYWLRTPDGSSLKAVMTIDHSGGVFKTDANYSNTGVVPAITIDFNLTPVLSGLGVKSNPYKLDLDITNQILGSFNSELKNLIESKVLTYKDILEKDNNVTSKEMIARDIESELLKEDTLENSKLIYQYFLAKHNVSLHRDLFDTKHLLEADLSEVKVFSDISSLSKDQKEAISRLTTYGILDGYSDGTFKPERKVSRSEASKIIALTIQMESKAYTNEFKDVTSDKWFANYVAGMKEKSLIKGYTDGSFKPYDTISFDEMSAIVSRVLQEENKFYTVPSTRKMLGDTSTVRNWADGDVRLLLHNDIIDNKQVYNGRTEMTRMDIVLLINEILDFLYE